ncbi:unnamed protein product [Gordionus sp. m RMFG-2023]|uniref:ATP synthase subunit b, mitochondrial-like n=1 Tax=Gordionus sp. m RMFG-2023 TaxID=3053472 RepID=UPI0030E05AAB
MLSKIYPYNRRILQITYKHVISSPFLTSTNKILNLSDNYPSKTKVNPERDIKNYPRLEQNMYPPKVRFGILPSSWFDFFYMKTGVTGSYLFFGGLVTTLLQKEIWVVETEFCSGIVFIGIQIFLLKMYGEKVKNYLFNKVENNIKDVRDLHQKHIQLYENNIESEKIKQRESEAPKYIAQFQRDNVALQLERNYRERLVAIHDAIKKRLDYKTEIINTKRSFEHQNMIDWIIRHVYASITPQLEKEAMNKCINDLKTLSKTAII